MKKTQDENHLRNTEKTTDRKPPSFQLGDRVYFKNKQKSKMGLKMETQIQDFCIECDGHYLHIENHATGKTRLCHVKDIVYGPPIEFWNIDTQFGRARNAVHVNNHLYIVCNYHTHLFYSIFLLGIPFSATLQ